MVKGMALKNDTEKVSFLGVMHEYILSDVQSDGTTKA